CCTQYRVAFHWMEADDCTPDGVPSALTERLDAHRLCIRGTRSLPVHCIALDAEIGVRSRCTIHPRRPSVCREVEASWENGRPSPQCDEARIAWGMAPLTAADWIWRAPANDGQPDDRHDPPTPPARPPIAA